MALSSPITACVLTVSDRCSKGITIDTSGPTLVAMLKDKLGAQILETAIVPDEVSDIGGTFKRWAQQSPKPDLILSTGGTGLAPRDVTPEATAAILERRHPALLELVRYRCYVKTPRTFLSRGESGTLAQTLIINLPGSVRGASECLEALLDILPHAIETLRGEVQDDGRPSAKPTSGKVIQHDD